MNELHNLEKCRIATPSTDAMYIAAGHVVAGTAGERDLLLSESVRREAQANSRDTDIALKRPPQARRRRWWQRRREQ